MTTLMTRPAVAVVVAAGDNEAVSVWPASSCWSWRTPCVILAAAPGQNALPTQSIHVYAQCLL